MMIVCTWCMMLVMVMMEITVTVDCLDIDSDDDDDGCSDFGEYSGDDNADCNIQ